jgi:hypothetical protein
VACTASGSLTSFCNSRTHSASRGRELKFAITDEEAEINYRGQKGLGIPMEKFVLFPVFIRGLKAHGIQQEPKIKKEKAQSNDWAFAISTRKIYASESPHDINILKYSR